MTVLYITYDGILDQLGQSQILPYVKDISNSQGKVVILSFEKTHILDKNIDSANSDIFNSNIIWKGLKFTSRLGLIGKIWDLLKMYNYAFFLTFRHSIKIIHARGHPTAQVGLFIKKFSKVKLIFDFRGLWVDERVDKGGWDLNNTFHMLQFRFYKKIEKKLLKKSDQIVVLTSRAVDEVMKISGVSRLKITVIPCCADFDKFYISKDASIKKSLGIPTESLVIGYLGSVGKMYLLEDYLNFFKISFEIYPGCYSFIITQDVNKMVEIIDKCLPRRLRKFVIVKTVQHKYVPNFLHAMDVMVSFISPSYARLAASPTKIAECFASGIPVISNGNIGDVDSYIRRFNGGEIVKSMSDSDLMETSRKLKKIEKKGGKKLRRVSRSELGLEFANYKYSQVYKNLKKYD